MSTYDSLFESNAITLLKGIYDNIGSSGLPYKVISGFISQPQGSIDPTDINHIVYYNNSGYSIHVSTTDPLGGFVMINLDYGGNENYCVISTNQPYPQGIILAAFESPPTDLFIVAKRLDGSRAEDGLVNGISYEIRFYTEP